MDYRSLCAENKKLYQIVENLAVILPVVKFMGLPASGIEETLQETKRKIKSNLNLLDGLL